MQKSDLRQVFTYSFGAIGPCMLYQLFANFLLAFVLYTRNLTVGQISVITGIMIAARVFDAFNDPLMGNIVEHTRTRIGKFKPWLIAGILSSAVVVYIMFNNTLEGWPFVCFFGITYFLYSITFTMYDISYWGMILALGSESRTRNTYTSLATTMGSLGTVLALFGIPMFTVGERALGGSASAAYGRVALLIGLISVFTIAVTIIGVRENRVYNKEPAPKISFSMIVNTVKNNDQLRWIALAFLFEEVSRSLVLGGIGSTYIYFEFGYSGQLYSLFTLIGILTATILLPFYPFFAQCMNRSVFLKRLLFINILGTAVMLFPGLFLPATMVKYWCVVIGYALIYISTSFTYLIMMVCLINTVEYNEYRFGERKEAIIASMRPFITKLSSAVIVILTTSTYLLLRVTTFTNQISNLETQANQGLISAEERILGIADVLSGVQKSQTLHLLLVATILPLVLLVISYVILRKKYQLDEAEYERICEALKNKET